MNEKENTDATDETPPKKDRLGVALALVGDSFVSNPNEKMPELPKKEMENLLNAAGKCPEFEKTKVEGKIVTFWPNAIMMAAAAAVVFAFVKYYDGEDPSTIPNKTSRQPITVAPHLPREIPESPVRSPVPIPPSPKIPNEGLGTPDPKRDGPGTNLVRLGNNFLAKGEYEKAINYFEQASDAQLKAYGRLHPDVAYTYSRIGETYKAKGEHEKAIEYLEKSLEIFFKVHGQ